MPTEKPSFGTLDGVKVVYAAVELACPKACDLMADWGADVTWLENTGAGDTIRDTAYIKQAERRNQRSVALNYFSEEGKEVFFKMIKDADIFLEASKGGTWARKGITDEVLWAINPKLVIVHISGFGQEGDPKMVKRAAYDLTVMAYSGLIMQNGTEEQPMLPGPYMGDYLNTLMIAASTLSALYRAEKTGKGESIDLAMYETLLSIGQYYLVDYLNAGIKWPRPGARNQNLCGIGEFQCKDGFLGVCLYGVDQNKHFLETIGLGHLWGTEDIPEDTSGLWLSNPHADEIQKAFEDYCLPSMRSKKTSLLIALLLRLFLIWKIWLRKSILLCVTPGLTGRPLMATPSMAWAYSPSSRTTPARFGVLCLTRAVTPSMYSPSLATPRIRSMSSSRPAW